MKQERFWEVHVYDGEYELVVEYDETDNNHVKIIEELHKMMNNMNEPNTLMHDMNVFIDFIKIYELKYYFKRIDD